MTLLRVYGPFVFMAGLAVLAGASPVLAVEANASPEKLQALRRAVAEGRAHSAELAAEEAKIRTELERLQKEMVVAAEGIASREIRLSELEAEAVTLGESEAKLTQELKARRHELAATLAALQRLGRTPSSALMLHSDDALTAARGAMILSSIAPKLEAASQALRADLTRLTTLRDTLEQEKKNVAQATGELEEERSRLNALIAERSVLQAALARESKETANEVVVLLREAENLEALIARLEAQAARILPRPKPPAEAGAGKNDGYDGTLRPPAGVSADAAPRGGKAPEKADIGKLAGSSTTHFAEARGHLRLPAQGKMSASKGSLGGEGEGNGALIKTRPNAQVVAPFDGAVRFAGPFRDYGHVLIIEMGGGYHVVLAGMARLNAIVGQRLLAGEPVGFMGSTAPASSVLTGGLGESDKGLPHLYVEFRKDGKPIDPLPWFASAQEKVSG
jgi:septal ring factor EnvC (AmiA/AmiB activator)